MEWLTESNDAERARKNAANKEKWLYERNWHRWFAWYPVRTSPTKVRWLSWIERRLDYSGRTTQPEWYYWDIRRFEYRKRSQDDGL